MAVPDWWDWWEEVLRMPTRAIAGDRCRMCGKEIEQKTHYKMRDRHLCGQQKCWRKLKTQTNKKIAEGEIDSYEKYIQKLYASGELSYRTEPKVFRTLTENFPYEFPEYPIEGDIIERHNVYTQYLNFVDVPLPVDSRYLNYLMSYLEKGEILVAYNPDTKAYAYIFIESATHKVSRMTFLSDYIFIDGQLVPLSLYSEKNNITYELEIIRDRDDDLNSVDAWNYVFIPDTLIRSNPLWTPAQEEYSKTRKRINVTNNNYVQRMNKMGIPISSRDIEDVDKNLIYLRDGGICQLCYEKIDFKLVWPHLKSATLDHIIPLTKGGTHEELNLQTAHLICNIRKGNTIISE